MSTKTKPNRKYVARDENKKKKFHISSRKIFMQPAKKITNSLRQHVPPVSPLP